MRLRHCAVLLFRGPAAFRATRHLLCSELVRIEVVDLDHAIRRLVGADDELRALAAGRELRRVAFAAAFVDAGAVQCGFCTPGLVVATAELLRRNASPSDDEVREALSGNLCRCTGYQKIFDAVRLAAGRA